MNVCNFSMCTLLILHFVEPTDMLRLKKEERIDRERVIECHRFHRFILSNTWRMALSCRIKREERLGNENDVNIIKVSCVENPYDEVYNRRNLTTLIRGLLSMTLSCLASNIAVCTLSQ